MRIGTLALVASSLFFAVAGGGCASTQATGAGGDVEVVVRRIDVLAADYDKMTLAVIVGIQNNTDRDVPVSADASIAIAGQAAADRSEGDGAGDGEQEEQQAAAPTPSADRQAGTGAGTAVAGNTSELPIEIVLPLPSDPAELEQVLGWSKMLVDVAGAVKVGGKSMPLAGQREVAPPHLPDVKLKEAQVASVDGGTAGTGFFTLILDNKNPFEVTVDKMAWTVTIKDKQLQPSTGVVEVERDPVPASAVAEYQTEVQLDDAAFGKDLKALLKNPTVPYVIEGTLEVRGIRRTFRFAGDMRFAR